MLDISTHKMGKIWNKGTRKSIKIPPASTNHSIVSRSSRIAPYHANLSTYIGLYDEEETGVLRLPLLSI
jgi:hypothetical protein